MSTSPRAGGRRRSSIHSSCSSEALQSPDSQVRPQAAQVVPHIAKLVAAMGITNPEVLRVTAAHKAFQHCVEAFRPGDRTLYHKSHRSENIKRFWSHSWHGNRTAKVLTLMVLYNGLAAVLLGTAVAFVMMCLFALGLLPGFSRVADHQEVQWSTWSLASGIVASVLGFIFWKPRQEVFFDRLCISEDDSDLKASAIFSLAGMLKNSQEMLVLWDPSWSDRLWCLFELSAFLKCRKAEDTDQRLIIRPTFVGPCSIIAYLTVCAAMLGLTTLPMPLGNWLVVLLPLSGLLVFGAVVGFVALVFFRGYFYSVQILEEKLHSASFDRVKSSCCDFGHVTASGAEMICDREVVKQCVATWFGSTEAFEESIRSEVADVVVEELRHDVFTKTWVLHVLSPVLWAFMDLMATHVPIEHYGTVIEMLVLGLVVWLAFGPMIFDLAMFLTRRYCAWPTNSQTFCADLALQLTLFFIMFMAVSSLCGCYIFTRIMIPTPEKALTRTGVFGGAVAIMYAAVLTVKSLKHVFSSTRSNAGAAPTIYGHHGTAIDTCFDVGFEQPTKTSL